MNYRLIVTEQQRAYLLNVLQQGVEIHERQKQDFSFMKSLVESAPLDANMPGTEVLKETISMDDLRLERMRQKDA